MSTTSIYAVKQDEEPIFIGECRNAFRSAMYVWHDIAKRYFGLDSFPMFDEEMQRRVWNAGNEKELTNAELIVLASTMDKATVTKEHISDLLQAFQEYGKEHGSSSISEQAELIANNLEIIPDGYSLAWIQTSVCTGWFREFDEDRDEYVCDTSDSFDVIEQVKEAA